MIIKLFPYTGEYRRHAILAPLLIIGEVIMEVLIPFVMAAIIDIGILGDGGISYTIRMGLLMILMACISLCFGALAGKCAAKAGTGFAKNLRDALFDSVQEFSFSNIDKFSTASLVTRLTTDVSNTQNAFMMFIRLGVRAPFMLTGATIMAVIISPGLSVVFLAVIPLLVAAFYLIGKNALPRFKNMLARYDAMNASVQENLTGMRVVKAYVREAHEILKFSENADAVRKAQYFAEKLIILNMPVMHLSMYACIVAVLWFGGGLVIDGALEIGRLSGFISYITQILMSLMMLSMIFIISIISRASASRIIEVLEEETSIRDNDTEASLSLLDGSIQFIDASFSYSDSKDNLTLEGINLMIHSGETVGIIGGTGSAKTTLVQLIPRLYDLLGGKLIVGGNDVRSYKLEKLRGEVAMVLQKNVLFSGTIRENLLWGNKDATDDDIEGACRSAQAHEFIMSFPDGYDTVLGQGGVNVSGGQKQRLCIARALLQKPKIMILDDSTSAVDMATDSRIRAALKQKLHGMTTIVIAQRISSIYDADRIIVMDDGKISNIGTHAELLKTSAIYRDVFESQQKGVE